MPLLAQHHRTRVKSGRDGEDVRILDLPRGVRLRFLHPLLDLLSLEEFIAAPRCLHATHARITP
jgi:hypothetical protein